MVYLKELHLSLKAQGAGGPYGKVIVSQQTSPFHFVAPPFAIVVC